MRALIINADDFGLTPGINAGILDTHTRGILTSASLIANAPATGDAIAIARRTPTLAVGCHLTLVDGCPVLPAAEVPTLAPDGRFRPTWTSFVRDLAMRRIRRSEMELELTAQVRRVIDAGLPLTHLDSHKHVHTHPSVFAIVARIAVLFGIRTVRVPFERPAVRLLCRHAFGIGSRQALENLALGPWAARDRGVLMRHGLAAPPHFFGRVLTGLFTPPSLQALLRSVPEGTSELMMHPGYPDADLDRVRTRLRSQRAHEVALLTDPSTLELVKDAEIRLTRPDGIVAERPS